MAPPSSAKGKTEDNNPLVQLLLSRHTTFVQAINSRSFVEAHAGIDWISPSFTAELMNYPFISSWQSYCEMFRDVVTESPEYYINVLDMSVLVREDLAKAEVFLLAEEIGQPPGVKTLASSKLTWKRDLESGEWLLWKHQMVRGANWDGFGGEGVM